MPMLPPGEREDRLKQAMARLTRTGTALPHDTDKSHTIESDVLTRETTKFTKQRIQEVQTKYIELQQSIPEVLKDTGMNQKTAESIINRTMQELPTAPLISRLYKALSYKCMRVATLCYNELETRLSDPVSLHRMNDVTLGAVGSYAVSRAVDIANNFKDPVIESATFATPYRDEIVKQDHDIIQ